ncbi:hypothetical protein ACFL03_14655 [Thermodesulfobacteriota bacterium]
MDLQNLIKDTNWTETGYITAHEYVILNKSTRPLVEMIKDRIETFGYEQSFKGKKYRYVDIDDYKYWYIHPVLNREKK